MSDESTEITVTESIDGAIMQEIGSPDGSHLEEVFEPSDFTFVDDGEITHEDPAVSVVDLTEEDETPDPVIEDVSRIEEVSDGELAEAPPAQPDPVTGQQPAPVEGDEGASPTAGKREAFSLRMDGQDIPVPDAYVEGDNVVIPREQFQRVVQPRLADRNAWIAERREYLQRIEDLAPERNPTVVKANALLEAVNAAFENEDSAYEFFKNFNANRDKLILNAERQALEAERKQFTSQRDRETAEATVAELQMQMDAGLGAVLDQAAQLGAYSNLDFEHVRSIIEPVKHSFFFRAAEDLPQFGLRKGEIGINIEKIEGVLQAEARRVQRELAARAAAERNAATLNESTSSGNEDPPAIEPDTPLVTEAPSEPKTREEWEARMAAVAAGR